MQQIASSAKGGIANVAAIGGLAIKPSALAASWPPGDPNASLSSCISCACTCVRRAALALAAGCVFRAKGGIALAAAVGSMASTLVALAASSPPSVHLWLLHGLLLVAGAAGLAFLPHVRPTLDLALAVLLEEGAAAVPGLRPAAGNSLCRLFLLLVPFSLIFGTSKCSVLNMVGYREFRRLAFLSLILFLFFAPPMQHIQHGRHGVGVFSLVSSGASDSAARE